MKMKFLGVMLVIISIVACNGTAKPKAPERYAIERINAYVRYMAQPRTLHAELTFKSDSLDTMTGEVTLNNEKMVPKKLPVVGVQYRKNLERVNFVNGYTFSYPEKDGTLIKWSVSLDKFQQLKIVSDGVSQSKGGLLKWEGEPLKKDIDGLVLLFTDSKGSTFQINHNGLTKGNSFEILPVHASRLAKGTANLMVTRKRTTVERKANEPDKIAQIEYYFAPMEFEVKE
jgi:hypothetical protein